MKKRRKIILICCVILAIVLLVICYYSKVAVFGAIAGALIGICICYWNG